LPGGGDDVTTLKRIPEVFLESRYSVQVAEKLRIEGYSIVRNRAQRLRNLSNRTKHNYTQAEIERPSNRLRIERQGLPKGEGMLDFDDLAQLICVDRKLRYRSRCLRTFRRGGHDEN
jgi:hypothetical protein